MSPGVRLSLAGLLVVILLLAAWSGCSSPVESVQRAVLFHPTHHSEDNGLTRWEEQGVVYGFASEVADPKTVWLMFHGNAGQAADRVYALPSFPLEDSVYFMEYPGYGQRPGAPSRQSIDEAAQLAYRALRTRFSGKPIAVVGESIGSGPASMMAKEAVVPDKIILITPFDSLAKVAARRSSLVPAGFLLGSAWDNQEALSQYRGGLEIYGAEHDEVIPVEHAKALAGSLPQARFAVIDGGHNDWAQGRVTLRYP
ncbi:MAG TPA: alpha/beta fold hydrolase [Opitutaceae bacterium]|nr:alpha/beta fold hydrolase [Opitutaceae bacterium]